MNDLKTTLAELNEHKLIEQLFHIEKDINDQRIFVVTVGQFSRGKSSLINALLNIDHLPVDVVPTTAKVHMIRLRKGAPQFRIGHSKQGQGSWRPIEELQNLTIDETDRGEEIEDDSWIEIGLDHPLLEEGVVIVDTPGTDDMNEMRAELVYGLIPRADLLLMVLSAKSQVHKSEEIFLKERLLKSATPKIVFALNKTDLIKDEEELEEVIEESHDELKRILPEHDHSMVPVSSKNNDVQGLIDEIRKTMTLSKSMKHSRAIRLYDQLQEMMDHEKLSTFKTLEMSENDYKNAMNKLKNSETEFERLWPEFQKWMQAQGVSRIMPLIHTSLDEHIDDLKEDILVHVASLSDLKVFSERILPRMLEKSMRAWLDRKLPELQTFANRYCKAVAIEYEQHFGQKIHLNGIISGSGRDLPEVLGETVDLDNDGIPTNVVKYGLPAAGALVAGLVLSGGFASVGLLGGHLWSSHVQKSRESSQKEQFEMDLPLILERLKVDYASQLEEKMCAFERQLANDLKKQRLKDEQHTEAKLQHLLEDLKNGKNDSEKKMQLWNNAYDALEQMKKSTRA